MFKFRDQLLITLILVGLLPAVLISYETFTHNSKQVENSSIDVAQKKLESVAQGLNHYFKSAENYAAVYARHPSVKTMDYAQFMPVLKTELSYLEPNFEKFIVGKPNGQFFNTSGANLLQGGIRTFDDKAADSKPKNIRKRDYWQKTILDNTSHESLTYVSNPMISYTTGVKQVVVASSILSADKKVIGMIGLSVGWSRIDALIQKLILQNFSSNEQAKILLVSSDGTYWYHWEPEKVIQLLKDNAGDFVLNSYGEKAVQTSNILEEEDASLVAIGQEMLSGKSAIKVININGKKQHVIYQPILGGHYSLALTVEDGVMMWPVYQALNHYLSILGVSLILIIIIGLILARYFSFPIAELVSKISLLTLGEKVEKNVQSKTKELQVLSTAIFNLYDKINQQSEQLEVRKERLSLTIKGSNDGIWDWGVEEDTLYLSPRCKEMLGLNASSDVTSLSDAFQRHCHPDDIQVTDFFFNELIYSQASMLQHQHRVLNQNMPPTVILVRCYLIRDDNDAIVRITGTNTDISALVARENEVIELNKELETKVKQRTEELEKTVVLAEQANSAKSLFLSNMSHEIRTPMNGIIGLTQLCLKTELNDVQKNYLNKIIYSSKTLMKILNEILDFNKIESNMIELENTQISVVDVCHEIESLLQPAADEKGIALIFQLSPSIPKQLMADPIRLTQILLNLCGNAIKFTSKGSVTLAVSLVQKAPHDAVTKDVLISFRIIDTGLGIKNKAEIFTAFKQEGASTTRKYGGTGLGLSISKRLVELMGGRLNIESEFGNGSCFSFELRLDIATTTEPKAANISIHEDIEKEDNCHLGGSNNTNVLIVDDNSINILIAEDLLKHAGYRYSAVGNGQEALDIMSTQHFDLVLMDIQMPVMDGETATKRLKSDQALQHIPVIAMTANVMTHEVENYTKIGFSGFIGKPFVAEDMLKIIADTLLNTANSKQQ